MPGVHTRRSREALSRVAPQVRMRGYWADDVAEEGGERARGPNPGRCTALEGRSDRAHGSAPDYLEQRPVAPSRRHPHYLPPQSLRPARRS
jgi:hypothetical protein